MFWTNFFIKRPVFSSSIAILIVFAGLFAYFHLPLRLYPKVELPVINISVNYPGASAETMQGFVTNTVENALAGIEGVNYITASSSQGHTDVDVHMNLGVNADLALTNIMQKVAAVRGQLPQSIDDPIVSKWTSNDDLALILAFSSDALSRAQISDYLLRSVKPKLESVNGVAKAQVLGGQYAMRIWLDPTAMAAYHLTTSDVVNALARQNVKSTVGSFNGVGTSLNIQLSSELTDSNEFNHIIIQQKDNNIIHLSDIGQAKLGNVSGKIHAFFKGKPAVMVFVTPEQGANPLTVIKSIKKLLPAMKQQLPAQMAVTSVVDVSGYINASIKEVVKTISEAIIIVAIIIFLFIGNLRAVFIPLVTIPISLIGIGFYLLILHYSLNTLTLLAMVIAIGLVVDDAIVVMENIHRYIEKGLAPLKAAIAGTKEIAFSIIAMTLTLAAIFAPIAFSSGVTGKLFSEFSFTLAGTVILSGIIALVLSPMMCARIMRPATTESRYAHFIESVLSRLRHSYSNSLRIAFRFKKTLLVIWLLSVIGCFYFYASTPKELAPKEDESYLEVIASATDSSTSHFLARNTQKFNPIMQNLSFLESYVYVNGIPSDHQALAFLRMLPWNQRKLSSQQAQPIVQKKLNQIAGLQSVAIVPSFLPGTHGFPIGFVIKTMDAYKALYMVTENIKQAARKSGLFAYIDDNLSYDQPELNINIDRNAAAAMGVSIDNIQKTLATLLSENKLQYFSMSGRSYEVIPQSYERTRLNPEQLGQIQVAANNGQLVPLSAIVTLHTLTKPASLNQFQKFNAVTLSAVIAPKHTLSEGLAFLETQAKKILPQSMSIDYSGNSRQFIQDGNRMLWLFLSAIIVIFIILAMQFESFRDPLIILLGSVPMAIFAALIPLKLGFSTINIYTQIGLLTLVGLISKHGILITKFANELCDSGKPKWEAIREAAAIRLRPILMTTAAIIFGGIPLVIASGAGSESHFDIGIVIICGVSLGTLFTLFVLPVIYYYISRRS